MGTINLTSNLGEVKFECVTRQEAGSDKPYICPWLQESQVPIDKEEENSGKNQAEIGYPDMDDVEEEVENVGLVCVEEKLEHLSPYPSHACHPHNQSKYKSNLSSYIWNVSSTPF